MNEKAGFKSHIEKLRAHDVHNSKNNQHDNNQFDN